MKITVTQGHLIRRAKSEGISAKETATKFGLPLNMIRAIYEGRESETIYFAVEKFDPLFEQQGRADLRKFLIASKSPDGGWPRGDTIENARRAYDRGEIDMAQGRSVGRIFLYSFPRSVKATNRQPYFYQRGETEIVIPNEE